MNSTSTSLFGIPNNPLTITAWDALMAGIGLSSGRQAEQAVLSQVTSTFLGLLTTGKLIPIVAPLIVKFLVLPLMVILKSVAKTLLVLGISCWLIATMLPFGMAYFGVSGVGAAIGRSFQQATGPYYQYLEMGPQSLITRGLRAANMDTLECRMQLACKAGELTGDSYPPLFRFMNDTGLIDLAEKQAQYDPYTSLAIKALRGSISCEDDLKPCTELYTIEALFDNDRVATVSNELIGRYLQPIVSSTMAPTTTSTTTTTTTEAPPTTQIASSDLVVNAIKRLAQHYYSYST